MTLQAVPCAGQRPLSLGRYGQSAVSILRDGAVQGAALANGELVDDTGGGNVPNCAVLQSDLYGVVAVEEVAVLHVRQIVELLNGEVGVLLAVFVDVTGLGGGNSAVEHSALPQGHKQRLGFLAIVAGAIVDVAVQGNIGGHSGRCQA